MFRGLVLSASFALCVLSFSVVAAAAPFSISFSKQIDREVSLTGAAGSSCTSLPHDAPSMVIADALDSMEDICRHSTAHDAGMLERANHALDNWIASFNSPEAGFYQARFMRALAALEAQAALLPINGVEEPARPALLLEPMTLPSPEIALFTLEEAAVPFLGIGSEASTSVMITVDAPGYVDNFTIYFPRGSVHLTLAAEDMIALAAEAVRGMDGVEMWVSPAPTLNENLAQGRAIVVENILRQNEVPTSWVHVDDGSLDAILNRPVRLSHDVEA